MLGPSSVLDSSYVFKVQVQSTKVNGLRSHSSKMGNWTPAQVCHLSRSNQTSGTVSCWHW